MTSIQDVAREANVAASTVSMVVNGRGRISDQTRQRVQDVIKQLGYQPRVYRRGAGRQKVRKRKLRIAFVYTLEAIIDNVLGSYCQELVEGVQKEMGGAECTLSILRGAEHIDDDVMVNHQLEKGSLDGVILFGPESHNGYLERLEQVDLPMVVINRLPHHNRFSCVTLDYYGGSRQAIDYLAKLGHRRIAIGGNVHSQKWLDRELAQGALDAAAQHGIEPVMAKDLEQYPDLPPHAPERVEAFCRDALDNNATAIYRSDKLAIKYLEQLKAWNIRVPEDISIVGFDDLKLSTCIGKPLTTVGYDKRYMGQMAARILKRLVQPKRRVCCYSIVVPAKLVEGETVAAVKA